MKKVGVDGDPNLAVVQLVAQALGDLRDQVVFVGGSAAGLLISRPRAEMIRATKDVDVVTEVVTMGEYQRFERALRRCGFANDQSAEAPICRWVRDGIILDAMPVERELCWMSRISTPRYPAFCPATWPVRPACPA